MSEWSYNFNLVEEIPEDAKAFVYVIHIDNKKYYGKKQFYKSIKRKPLKGYKRHRRDTVESNWRKYCSSSDDVKKLVEEGHEPERKIIRFCSSLKEATWYERKLLFRHIADDDVLNKSIDGKIFKEEVQKWESMT